MFHIRKGFICLVLDLYQTYTLTCTETYLKHILFIVGLFLLLTVDVFEKTLFSRRQAVLSDRGGTERELFKV